MQINPISSVVGQYTAIKTVTPVEKKVSAASVDKTELSDEAKLFTQAFAAAKKSLEASRGENYAQRVEDATRRVESGTYSVDVKELAGRIMLLV